MKETEAYWTKPDDPAAGFTWAIREKMRQLIAYFASDEDAMQMWIMNLDDLIGFARTRSVTNAQDFMIIQYARIPEEVAMQARDGSPGWETRVRKYLHGVLKERGLEERFLKEVWDPGSTVS
ncbi:MAG: hypothetical protein RL681_333 [Candidatus Parcubacteria bacterium]